MKPQVEGATRGLMWIRSGLLNLMEISVQQIVTAQELETTKEANVWMLFVAKNLTTVLAIASATPTILENN